MNKNIMVYYQLENFYQNHRRYIQSKIEYPNNSISLGLMGKNYFNDIFDGWKIKGSDNLKFNDLNIARKSDLEITDQMVKWHNAGGKPLLGLKRRRCEEANIFLGRELYYVDSNGIIKKK
jgi:hypothetical protein